MNSFSRKPLIFEVQNQPQCYKSLQATNMKHRKIMCLFQLDTAPGRAAGTVELNSPIDRSVNAVLLPDTRTAECPLICTCLLV